MLLKQEASCSLGTSDKDGAGTGDVQESHSSAYLSALSAGSHSLLSPHPPALPRPPSPPSCFIPACCLSHYHLSSTEWNRRTLSHASSASLFLEMLLSFFFFFLMKADVGQRNMFEACAVMWRFLIIFVRIECENLAHTIQGSILI